MVRTVLFVVLGVSGGLALATLFQGKTIERLELPEAAGVSPGRASAAGLEPLAQRLYQLEAALKEEIANRAALEEQLAALTEALADPRGRGPQRREGADDETEAFDPEEMRARIAERSSAGRGGDPTERRLGRLTQAGFSADEAQRILQRESELRMESLYEQYEASRQGEPLAPPTNGSNGRSQLRQELGDAAYERYLAATGQSTRVPVRQVLASSPGEAAGLKPGDEIVAYGGERVFSTTDLNRLTLEGNPGQTVALDIIRDGQPAQVFVPRGPIGITSGRGPRFRGPAR